MCGTLGDAWIVFTVADCFDAFLVGRVFNLLIPGKAFLSLSHNPSRNRTYSENVIMVKYLR
jgi:hypothetical protein